MSTYWITLIAVSMLLSAVVDGDKLRRTVSLSEWEESVISAASHGGSRAKRGTEPEDAIADVQEHYRNAFKELEKATSTAAEYKRQGTGMASVQSHHTIGDIAEPVYGRYIVTLDDSLSNRDLYHTIAILEDAYTNSKGHLVAKHIKPFHTIGKGFTATLGRKVIALLQSYPYEYAVEQDMAFKRHNSMQDQPEEADTMSYRGIPWNLDRLDQHTAHLDGYYNPEGDGHGVDVYILDTGILYSHHDLEGRAHYMGYDAIDELGGGKKQEGLDCNDHGTHCAATVAGKTFGVAKKANLYSARVLNCEGSGAVSGIIHTMEFIVKKRTEEGKKNRAVFSMSLGVERSEAFNRAANVASKAGIVVVSASGNQGKNSCDYSPGSAEMAISVAASDVQDSAVSFSNLGKCVTIFAPGDQIKSASSQCDTCTTTKSGTSMACPHAAGLAAIILGEYPSLTTQEVKQKISNQATKDAITIDDIFRHRPLVTTQDSTPNLLLYVNQKQ